MNAPLVIGLVNNTADGALAATERQFRALLAAALGEAPIDLVVFSCPEIARATPPRALDGTLYTPFDRLFETSLDALIVTGMEPTAGRVRDEPAFTSIAEIADWAEARALPVIWSCLAAHAAVLHLDGIERERLPHKLAGVFTCDLVAPRHELADGLPPRWDAPHSRRFKLPEDRLTARGYTVLSRSPEAGADIFLRPMDTARGEAPFLFFQGHPEYGAQTLLREYRRDLFRYMAGSLEIEPSPPVRGPAGGGAPWRAVAARVVGNWMARRTQLHAGMRLAA